MTKRKTSTNKRGHTMPAIETTQPEQTPDAVKAEPVAAVEPAPAAQANVAVAADKPAIQNPSTVVDPTTGEEIKVRRSIVPVRFKERYRKHGGTNGDDVALELKAATTTINADKRPCLDLPAIKAIAEANGVNWRPYEGLNNGQWRMNIGNKLRGLLDNGKDVVIGTRTFKAEEWTPRERTVKPKATNKAA